MSIADNKALVCRFYDAFNQADAQAFDALLSEQWINHPADPGHPDTRDGFKAGMKDFHSAFEGFRLTRNALMAEDDLVVCRITMTGRHVGVLGEWQPSGAQETLQGMDMHRIANGRIVETWHFERLEAR